MNDLETTIAMLARAKLTFERLEIHDGSVEISKLIDDMLNMKYVKVSLRFSKEGDLRWVDAEVRQ